MRRIIALSRSILIGFIAGIIAKFIRPDDNEPCGFILATIRDIVSGGGP